MHREDKLARRESGFLTALLKRGETPGGSGGLWFGALDVEAQSVDGVVCLVERRS